MPRAYTVMDILNKKYELIEWSEPWKEAFHNPEMCGVWFIWGNSGNGKSSFVMQLIKELAKIDKVFLDALEEGNRHTMQQLLAQSDMKESKKNVLIGCETMAELDERLSKHKSPRFVIIDSFQYTWLSFEDYFKFKNKHSDKLLIFTSQCEGKQPLGRTAGRVKFDATLKIWVEGFKAISNGRYNPGGEYVIWPEKAQDYWGTR